MPLPFQNAQEAKDAFEQHSDNQIKMFEEKRKRLLTPWRELLTEKELQEVNEAQFYIYHLWDGKTPLSDGKRLQLIVNLTELLDERDPVLQIRYR